MRGADDLYFLEVAVRPGVEVRPGNGGGEGVVALAFAEIRVLVLRVEIMRLADGAQRAHRRAQIHVIAGDQQASAAAAEARDRFAVRVGQSVARIDCKQPKRVE